MKATAWTLTIVVGLLSASVAIGQGGSAGRNGAPPAATAGAPAPQRIDIAVTAKGFVPAQAKVKVGQPVTLVVTRTVERTCAKDIVIKDYNIKQPLPLNKAVEVTFTPTKPGKIRYACGMDMIAGELIAE